MDPGLKHKIRLSIVVVIFLLYIVGFIRPWIIISEVVAIQYIYVSDPLMNPIHIAKIFQAMQIPKNDIQIILALILFSSMLYLLGLISTLGGFKDLRCLIVSGALALTSSLIWIIMYNYLLNIYPQLGKFLILGIWPYIVIATGAGAVIAYIFLKPD